MSVTKWKVVAVNDAGADEVVFSSVSDAAEMYKRFKTTVDSVVYLSVIEYELEGNIGYRHKTLARYVNHKSFLTGHWPSGPKTTEEVTKEFAKLLGYNR
jgi:2-methylisocitrate lyase-like PEP mutase family enzyme